MMSDRLFKFPLESTKSLLVMPSFFKGLSALLMSLTAVDKLLITFRNPVPALSASRPLLLKTPIALAVSDKLIPAP